MAFTSRVFRILIASPSDVKDERDVVTRVIQEWNDLYSFEKKVVLLPIKWETHSSPELGTRPQETINKEVVDHCDLAIGVFWTRIGSPTGISDSGTIEEIERVGVAGKTVMLYFSKAKVELDEVDLEQYRKLKEFKKKTYPQGLVESYSNLIEFKDKLAKQLELKIRNIISKDSKHIKSRNIKDSEKQTIFAKEDVVEIIQEYLEEKKHKIQSKNVSITELAKNVRTDIEKEIKVKPKYDATAFITSAKSTISKGGFPDKTATKIHSDFIVNKFQFDFMIETPKTIYVIKIKPINIHGAAFAFAGDMQRVVQQIKSEHFPNTIVAKGKSLQPILIVPSLVRYLGVLSHEIPLLKFNIEDNTFKNWDIVMTRFIYRQL